MKENGKKRKTDGEKEVRREGRGGSSKQLTRVSCRPIQKEEDGWQQGKEMRGEGKMDGREREKWGKKEDGWLM